MTATASITFKEDETAVQSYRLIQIILIKTVGIDMTREDLKCQESEYIEQEL